jgi:FdhE protein
MKNLSERTLHKTIDEILEKKPYCRSVLNAFRQILVERNRLIEQLKLDGIVDLRPEEWESSRGVPLIRRQSIFCESDPWRNVAISLIPALQEGFPDLGLELDRIKVDILGGRILLYEYFRLYPDEGAEVVDEWAARSGVRNETLRFLLLNIARIILAIRAKDISPVIRDMPWGKGCCPICGALPMLSIFRDQAQRWLRCSLCGHEWRFSRVTCPFCEHESPAEMNFYFLQDRQDESAFACGECKRYLISVNRPAGLSEVDPDIVAISLLHLDLMMQERGFQPVAECGWNVL